jgi:hypothetical protein
MRKSRLEIRLPVLGVPLILKNEDVRVKII